MGLSKPSAFVPRLMHSGQIFAVTLRHLLHLTGHHSNFARLSLLDIILIEPLADPSSVVSSELLLNYGTHCKST